MLDSVASCDGLQGGCALAGWCFTDSAASVRDGYLYVPAPANPQEMPFGPSSYAALKNKPPEEESKFKKFLNLL